MPNQIGCQGKKHKWGLSQGWVALWVAQPGAAGLSEVETGEQRPEGKVSVPQWPQGEGLQVEGTLRASDLSKKTSVAAQREWRGGGGGKGRKWGNRGRHGQIIQGLGDHWKEIRFYSK